MPSLTLMQILRTEESKTEAAEMAGLRYVSDDEPGFMRQKWGRGFTYRDPDGICVKDPSLRDRFEELTIPPSWTDVWICLFDDGHIQATGRDEAGRKQYIYHPEWAQARARQRFSRLHAFGRGLARLRVAYDSDLRKRQLSKTRVSAIAAYLLDRTHIRVGRRRYHRRNDTAGLVTLQPEDVRIGSRHLVLEFVGKSGQERRIRVDDRRLARQVGQIARLDQPDDSAEPYLLVYRDGDQNCLLDADDLNVYLEETMGSGITGKDFRTWAGTSIALDRLVGRPAPDERAERILDAVDAVAEHLGNTRAVAREHYIAPRLLEQAESGDLWDRVPRDASASDHLTASEVRTIAWLEETYEQGER